MEKFLPLLVCLLLSSFTGVRATKPAYSPLPDTKTAQKNPTGQEADAKPLLKEANTDEEATSDDDDSMDDASGDEREDINDDDDIGGVGDEGTEADVGGDDDGGDDGSDDGGK